MDILRQDIQYAVRRLFRSPSFTLVAILTLALGIGANTAIFSVVNGVLLQPLPFDEPDRLVGVFQVWKGDTTVMSPPNFMDLRAQNEALEDAAAIDRTGYTLTGAGDPIRVESAQVSASFFDVLRLRPALGRGFRREENEPGKHHVVVLGNGLWKQRFSGDPQIIGKAITLDGLPYTVVGVAPAGFSYPSKRELWTPVEHNEGFLAKNRGAWFLRVVGRLKPGTTIEGAASQAATIAKRLEQKYPASNEQVGMTVKSLHESTVGSIRTALLVLLGAVGFVLLIACANVANLLLARAAAREGEMAVRAALGAGRMRLLRQLLTESLILGVLGGAFGLLIAVWGSDFLVSLQPQGVPRLEDVRISGPVIAFTAMIAVLTGLLFGIIPAIQVTRGNLAGTLKEGGRGGMGARGSTRLRGALVVAEMALAVMLLAGAGLLMKSFVRLQSVNPGFRTDQTLSFELALPEADYKEDARTTGFFQTSMQRLAALPGVRAAGAVLALPLSGSSFNLTFKIDGRAPAKPGEEPAMEVRVATPEYFQTMGIPLLRGRTFTASDREGTPQVVLLSQAAVREFFPGEDPIGRKITLGWGRGEGKPNAGGEVIGVVGDVKELGLDEDHPPQVYLPHAQLPIHSMDVVLRTEVPPLSLASAVRRELHELDPNVPIAKLRTMEDLVAESISQPRFYMMLLAAFAVVALVLAAVGIFGVMSYAVAQRTREIGIRIALGAHHGRVVGMVVRQAMSLAVLGVALGVVAALALSRTLTTLLFNLSPTDPATFLEVAAMLAIVALLASYVPARRASRLDPVVALRAE